MAPASPASDGSQSASAGPKKGTRAPTADKEDSVPPEEAGEDGDGDGDGEAEEEEYEIEQIIEAKRGAFPGNKIGYFVKWKGYPHDQNSWVSEDDAGNAQEVIDEFWRKKKAEKKAAAPRKSTDKASAVKAATKGRKSGAANDTGSDAGSAAARKRSRPRKSGDTSDQENVREKQDGRAKKKAKKGETPARETEVEPISEDEVGDMKRYMNVASWEHIVDTIDTVERTDEGDLFVYFQLKDTHERVREPSELCAERFPQKLIKFYESNLRWKVSDAIAEDDS